MPTVDTSNRYDFLDVARGLAALLVLVEHAGDVYVPGFVQWSYAFGSLGRIGVVIFLMVTGFIIPQSLERSGSVGRFWVRRVFRLFPVYWLSVVLFFAYAGTHPPTGTKLPAGDTAGWLVNLTMVQRLFGVQDAFGVYWTLFLELAIYAGCTALFLTHLNRHWKTVLVVAIAGYGAAGLAWPLVGGAPFTQYGPNMGRGLLYVTPLFGVVLHLYVSGRLSRRGAYGFVAAWAAVYGLVAGVNAALYPGDFPAKQVWQHYLMYGSAVAVLFGLAELRRRRMPAAAVWFGRISYSVYLLHGLWLCLLNDWGWKLKYRVPAYFAFITATSAAAYYLVELPGIALGRKVEQWLWGRKKRPTPVRTVEDSKPALAMAA